MEELFLYTLLEKDSQALNNKLLQQIGEINHKIHLTHLA